MSEEAIYAEDYNPAVAAALRAIASIRVADRRFAETAEVVVTAVPGPVADYAPYLRDKWGL